MMKSRKDLIATEETKRVTDQEAESEIRGYISKRKKRGLRTVSIIDFVCDLDLDPEQVERIMERLEGRRVE